MKNAYHHNPDLNVSDERLAERSQHDAGDILIKLANQRERLKALRETMEQQMSSTSRDFTIAPATPDMPSTVSHDFTRP